MSLARPLELFSLPRPILESTRPPWIDRADLILSAGLVGVLGADGACRDAARSSVTTRRSGRLSHQCPDRDIPMLAPLTETCDIVTMRQSSGTANGVMLMTLDDETGTIHIIVWQSLPEKYRREAPGYSLHAVYSVWRSEGKVRYRDREPGR